jgi:hypothetical protein
MGQPGQHLSDEAIRAAVEHALGAPLTDKQWKVLFDSGEVRAVNHGGSVKELVRQVRRMREAFGDAPISARIPPAARPRTEIVPAAGGDSYVFSRQDALCLAVAAEATRDAEVVAFRRDVLNDRLPTYALDRGREGVETWVSRQWDVERPQREALSGDLPELTYIEYVGQGLRTLPVVPGGILDRLRQLGDRLAKHYHWQPHAAVAFVLSDDAVPNISVLTATVEPNQRVPALTRITVTADPAATPAAVARAYRAARNRIAQARAREMHPKTLYLAVFAAERPPREPIAPQLAAWNARVPEPEWQYRPEQAANFVRDRNAALRRLLRPEYQLPSQEETITYDDQSGSPSNRPDEDDEGRA